MKRTILFAAFLSLLLLGFITAQAQMTKAESKQAAALRAQLTAVHAKVAESCGNKNPTAIASFFADDAQILHADRETARGKGGVQLFFASAFKYGVRQVKLNLEEVGGEGNFGYEIGTITLYNEQGEIIKDGRYIMLLKKVGKDWKIYRLLSDNKAAK
jgi:ketosteroid isomerase-like protein